MNKEEDRTFLVLKNITRKIKTKSLRDESFKKLFGDVETFDGLKKFCKELDPNTGKKHSLRSFSMGLNITGEEADLFDNYFSADKSKFSENEIMLFKKIGINF